MLRWYEGLPPRLKAGLKLLGALLSSFAGSLSETLLPYGILAGITLVLWVVLETAWHSLNRWREKQGKPSLALDPAHVIAAGFAIVAVGSIWQSTRPAGSASQLKVLTSKIDAFQASLAKYVEPRKLTEEQISKIEAFLLPRAKQKLRVVCDPNNTEAHSYGGQIYQAFSRAGWEVLELRSAKPTEPLSEGLSFQSVYPRNTTRNMTVAEDVRRAFETAGVPIGGYGDSRNGETDDIVVTIYVGHKPRT